MRTLVKILLFILALMALGAPWAQAQQSVEMVVYFSPACSHCTYFREEMLPPIQQAYGDRLKVTFVDITQAEGLRKLEADEARLKQRGNALPIIVIGDRLISTEDDSKLQAELTQALRASLGASTQAGISSGAAAAPTPAPLAAGGPIIHLAYVAKDGCQECARAEVLLEVLRKEYPTLQVTTFNNVRDADLIEAMGEYLGLPQVQRLVAPAFYVGRDALVGDRVTSDQARALLNKYAASGAPAFWQGLDSATGRSSILARFRSMGPLAVVLAGLVDGVNPCAFATIIFFVSYLAISRRPRRELIAVGLAFTAGVFVTYFLVGMGFMSLLRLASAIRILGLILYGAMMVSCFVFAGLSAYDYVLARRGRLHEMRLNLPEPVRERIKGRIRSTSQAFLSTAFISGLIVSLLELACTGQVYLPTISFVVGIPQMRLYAAAYLLLYNLFFIVPLLLVLFLAVYGVSAARFQDWFVQNAARTKLVMVVLFLLLGLLLLSQVISMV